LRHALLRLDCSTRTQGPGHLEPARGAARKQCRFFRPIWLEICHWELWTSQLRRGQLLPRGLCRIPTAAGPRLFRCPPGTCRGHWHGGSEPKDPAARELAIRLVGEKGVMEALELAIMQSPVQKGTTNAYSTIVGLGTSKPTTDPNVVPIWQGDARFGIYYGTETQGSRGPPSTKTGSSSSVAESRPSPVSSTSPSSAANSRWNWAGS
jgi:hypothetical protein